MTLTEKIIIAALAVCALYGSVNSKRTHSVCINTSPIVEQEETKSVGTLRQQPPTKEQKKLAAQGERERIRNNKRNLRKLENKKISK